MERSDSKLDGRGTYRNAALVGQGGWVAEYITTQGSVLGLITQSSPYADHCVQVTQGWDYTPPELNYVRGRQGLNPPRMESQLELAGASTKCPLEHLFPASRARLATYYDTRNEKRTDFLKVVDSQLRPPTFRGSGSSSY